MMMMMMIIIMIFLECALWKKEDEKMQGFARARPLGLLCDLALLHTTKTFLDRNRRFANPYLPYVPTYVNVCMYARRSKLPIDGWMWGVWFRGARPIRYDTMSTGNGGFFGWIQDQTTKTSSVTCRREREGILPPPSEFLGWGLGGGGGTNGGGTRVFFG